MAVRRVAVRARLNDLSRAKSGLRSYAKESPRAGTIEDYRSWRAMGEGGTSPTWAGYLASSNAEKTIAFQDTLDSGLYRDPAKYATGWSQASRVGQAAAYKSFLIEPLPLRIRPRSKAKTYVFPQRERNADEHLDPEIREAYDQRFHKLGEDNATITEWKTSALEKHGTALFIKQSLPLSPLAFPTKREICHIHTSDWSGHVTLSFADAQEVIAKGWGERHRFRGTDWIQLGYTMVHVPRTVEETEVLCRIFQAGIDFVRNEWQDVVSLGGLLSVEEERLSEVCS